MSTVRIATRGSALALAQANMVLSQCRSAFPDLCFELNVIKTTGDKLQTASISQPPDAGTKGLFTKELEIAMLEGEADFAVHSLKDLPTELPEGLALLAVCPREDVRDVLLYRAESGVGRGYAPGAGIEQLAPGATAATSSTRRQAQLLAVRPDLKVVPIRGNVGTRLRKIQEQPELDSTLLAAAGLKRLGYVLRDDGRLEGKDVPEGILASYLSLETMLPCAGQAAIGIEGRIGDSRAEEICRRLNDPVSLSCVLAERAFLAAMGGGCLSPVAVHATVAGEEMSMRAVSFQTGPARRAEARGPAADPAGLGRQLAGKIS